jgi:hypothetical protein
MRRTGSGEYVPVPEDYLFAPADEIRIRVEANANGWLSVTDENREPVYAAQVTPGFPVDVPRTLAVSDRDRSLYIRFSPGLTLAQPEIQTLRSEFRSGEAREAAPMGGARMTGAAPVRADKGSGPGLPGISLRVVLRHKP